MLCLHWKNSEFGCRAFIRSPNYAVTFKVTLRLDKWNQTRKCQWWNKTSRDVPKRPNGIHSASNPTGLRSSSVMGFCIGVFEIWTSVTWDVAVDSKFSTSGEYKMAHRNIDVGNPVGKHLIKRKRLLNGRVGGVLEEWGLKCATSDSLVAFGHLLCLVSYLVQGQIKPRDSHPHWTTRLRNLTTQIRIQMRTVSAENCLLIFPYLSLKSEAGVA